jgi:predicted RNA binding protein YcfA (HicA-like mRNA interferase family)
LATFGDLEKFLKNDGWSEEPNLARGRSRGGDHRRYAKPRPSGMPLRTKVSRHPHDEIGPDLFGRILRDQLRVTEEEFWSVVRGQGGEQQAKSAPPSQGTPGWLVQRLIHTAGMSEDEVLRLSPGEALEAWEAY